MSKLFENSINPIKPESGFRNKKKRIFNSTIQKSKRKQKRNENAKKKNRKTTILKYVPAFAQIGN